MDIKDGYYVDSRDNRWDASLYSAEHAEELSKTLIMCRFCTNCEFCNYCDDCTNCRACTHCRDCINCTEVAFCCSCARLHKASMFRTLFFAEKFKAIETLSATDADRRKMLSTLFGFGRLEKVRSTILELMNARL